uniref:Uncharacterized protein n=1 Tax=Romanomermis culicivorax TaxID=13658 RepID=A0A915LAV8_ROMCU
HIFLQLPVVDRDLFTIWLAKEVKHFSSIVDIICLDQPRIKCHPRTEPCCRRLDHLAMTFNENNPKYKHGFFHVRTMIVIVVAVQSMCFWYELINFGVTRSNHHRNFQALNKPIYRKYRNFSNINDNSSVELSLKNSSVFPFDDSTSKSKEYDKFCAGAWNPVRGHQFSDIATMLYDGMMLLFCIFVMKAVRLTVPKLIIPKLTCDFIAAYTSGFGLAKMLIDPFLGSIPPSQVDNFWYEVILNCWCTIVNGYIFHISLNCYKYLNEKKQFFEQTALDIIAAAVVASNSQQQNQAENCVAGNIEIFVDLPPAYPASVAQENAGAAVDDGCLPSYEEVKRLASTQVKIKKPIIEYTSRGCIGYLDPKQDPTLPDHFVGPESNIIKTLKL